MFQSRLICSVAAFIVTACVICHLPGCSSGSHSPASQPGPVLTSSPGIPASAIAQEILATPSPTGVDDVLWTELTQALADAVMELRSQKISSMPPHRSGSAAQLSLDSEAGELRWLFNSIGDYDQNGEVNVSDLTPLAINFGATGPFDYASVLSLIDGDDNGEVNLADITPIALNYAAQLSMYKICQSMDPADRPTDPVAPDGAGSSKLGDVLLANATGDPTVDRLAFSYVLDNPPDNSYFWVRPVDLAGAVGTPSNLSINPGSLRLAFEQVDYTLHGVTVVDSPYGNVQVSYTGTPEPQYFNLVADGRWVIQNIPVLAHNGVGENHTVWMGFNLGVAEGTEKTELVAAASLTDDVLADPPVSEVTVDVADRIVRIVDGRPSGGGGGSFKSVSEGEGPGDEVGGKVADSASHGAGFPNQDCGDGQCAAAGVSNSLQFLADTQGFAMGDNADPPGSKPIDLATVDGAMGNAARATAGWGNTKSKWLLDNGYPVWTEGIPPVDDQDHEATSDECEAAMDALKEGKDVEMNGESHTAALVGMARLEDGRYVMYVAHDTNQGTGPDNAGGTAVEKIIYDPDAPLPEASDGYGFADGMINGFVVESNGLLIDSWPHMNFEQFYTAMDNPPQPQSGTGRCRSEFESPDTDSYFNLTFNGEWIIRNMPVPMFGDPGEFFETAIPFNLGVPDGTRMEYISYGAEISTVRLDEAPSREVLNLAGEANYIMASGEILKQLTYNGPPANNLWWFPAPIVDSAYLPLDQVVNQDCGEGECVPVAVSNSLKMLKALHPVEMAGLTDDPGSTSDDTDTDTMKPATGWEAGPPPGAPGIIFGGSYDDPDAWWNQKAAWMDSNPNYPVSTELITDAANISDVLEAVRNGQDVELRVPGHVVMVTGVVELGNGDYLLWVAHDTEQGADGGTVIEPVYFDAGAGVFRGAAWADNVQLGNGQGCFVVETATGFDLSQTDWNLDHVFTGDSAWGSQVVDHLSTGDLQYFNLSIGGTWAVQNLPIPPFAPFGIAQSITTRFNLGVAEGTPAGAMQSGFSLSPTALPEAPEEVTMSNIGDEGYNMVSGEPGASILHSPPPEEPIDWFIVPITGWAAIPAAAIANQDCGDGECAPTAVSNSLKMLKNLHPTEMDGLSDDAGSTTDDTDIDTMKPVTGWDADPPPGAPGIPVGGDYADPDAWWNLKCSWMDSNTNYPISTSTITDPANIADILDALNNGEDVELRVPGHVVMVVGAIQYANGDYVLYVAHDTDQENDGGTVIEPIYFDAGTNTFSGPPWADGYELGNGQALFVVESVDAFSMPSTWDYLGITNMGDGSEGNPGWVFSTDVLPFTLTHPIFGDVTTDVDTALVVNPPGTGSFTGGDFNFDPLYEGVVELAASFHATPAEPPSWYFNVYNRKADSIYVWPSADQVIEGDTVLLTVYCNETLNPFLYLSGVRVTMEPGNNYVLDSLNVGEPGGEKTWADGVWWDIDPPGGFELPLEAGIVPVPVGGRIGYDFYIVPVGGADLFNATGALFNFEVEVHSDISLSFQRMDGPTPMTHYGDSVGFDYFWVSDDNLGAPGVEMLPAP